jgi:hypothetical protein
VKYADADTTDAADEEAAEMPAETEGLIFAVTRPTAA